jgi:hypothetical protein
VVATCLEGYRDCDSDAGNGCEVKPDDPHHCGECNHTCALENASAVCRDGKCRVERCRTGFGDCDDDHESCETALDTLTDCGACAAICDKDSCPGGVCTAADCHAKPGAADCDGDEATCEVDLRTDLAHCGRCGNACAFDDGLMPHGALTCRDGVCRPVCDPGYGDCDYDFRNGCESPFDTLENCGACRRACAITDATESCESQQCEVLQCDIDRADCDSDAVSCETQLDTVEHCGSCDAGCAFAHATPACRGAPGTRACALVSCEPDWADCDGLAANGCERDLRSVSEGGEGPCTPDSSCQRATFGDHVYFVCERARSWDDARAHCRTQAGGDLAVIDTAGESDFLRTRVRTRHWIGHTDQGRRGVWSWARTGIEFWSSGLSISDFYARWAFGEPNPFGDCGAFYTSGLLGALVCSLHEPFVCEVDSGE